MPTLGAGDRRRQNRHQRAFRFRFRVCFRVLLSPAGGGGVFNSAAMMALGSARMGGITVLSYFFRFFVTPPPPIAHIAALVHPSVIQSIHTGWMDGIS